MNRKNSDLTGKRFGHMTVIKRAPNHVTSGGNSIVQWECQCDCGNTKIIKACHLRDGHTQSCGVCGLTKGKHELDDLTGQKFGYLTVLKRADNHVSSGNKSFVAWECQCDCGNIVTVTSGHLKSKHNRSCGKCGKFDRGIDFTGQRFGRLVVLERCDEWYTYPNGNRDFKWFCQCDCGNTTITRGNILRNKHFSQSCGCWRKEESIKDEDMIGRDFGSCRVESRADRIYVTETASVDAWKCVCVCGNHFVARGPQLRFGKAVSCGCLSTSKWETWTAQFLDAHKVSYKTQKTYNDLRGVGGHVLLYDFCITGDDCDVLIECQGLQHYQPVDYFGGQESFERQVEHDKRKREYAKVHNIPLIEIDCSEKCVAYEQFVAILSEHIGKYVKDLQQCG